MTMWVMRSVMMMDTKKETYVNQMNRYRMNRDMNEVRCEDD